MSEVDLGSVIAMVKPILYVLGAYILFSVIRSIFTKNKGNDTKKQGSKKV